MTANPIVGSTDVEGLSAVSYNVTGIQLAPAAGWILARQNLNNDRTEYYIDVALSHFDGYTDVHDLAGNDGAQDS